MGSVFVLLLLLVVIIGLAVWPKVLGKKRLTKESKVTDNDICNCTILSLYSAKPSKVITQFN